MKVKPPLVALLLGLSMTTLYAQHIDESMVNFIREKATRPADYIIEKFKKYDVVLLGEHHLIKQNLVFFQNLVPELYKNGIFNIGMEFGASEVQGKLDSLVNAETYNESLAREIMYAYNVAWGYQEYLDVYKAAWKLNRSLPNGSKKFRILNLSYLFNWNEFTGQRTIESMQAVFKKGTVDKYRAERIEEEVLRNGEKIVALVGTPHAYTRYGSPYFKYNGDDFCDYDHDWLGCRLYRKYPDRVFNILLHQAFTKMDSGNYLLISPAQGAMERLMKVNGNKPLGFDLAGTPIGNLPDSSIHSMCYRNFTLGQLFDGYIFLEPLSELEGCTVIEGFVNEGNIEHTLLFFPDPDWHKPVKSLEDVRQFIQDNAKQISLDYNEIVD
jgi:hypothetical protein